MTTAPPPSSAASKPPPAPRRGNWGASALELLSSMRFAIALLALVSIASVMGTIVKQAEPKINYINQFGLFWADVFEVLGLPRVYSVWWFLLILAFLVLSTSLCIARNTPKILRHWRDHKEGLSENALASFGAANSAQGHYTGPLASQARALGDYLAAQGWRVKLQTRANGVMLAAKAGSANKLGYIAAHSSIVLICLGGLLDGDLLIRLQTAFGGKSPYIGDGYISQIPAQHRLSAANPSFRGNMRVPEGAHASAAILSQTRGVLIQDLPFSIELKKFVVDYYSTGMPKLFASDIIIHDKQTGAQTPARVEVNHPVTYRGTTIYQSSFEDGGSVLRLHPIVLDPATASNATPVEGRVGENVPLPFAQPITLELTDLRTINVENLRQNDAATDVRAVNLASSLNQHLGSAASNEKTKHLKNIGPSFSYKLRDAQGQAFEFNNYMLPVELEAGQGRVFLLGVRGNMTDSMRYLRVPADREGSLAEFVRLRAALADPALRQQATARYAQNALATDVAAGQPQQRAQLVRQLQEAAEATLGRYTAKGLGALAEHIEAQVPAAERERASEYTMRMLAGTLYELVQLTRAQAQLQPLTEDAGTRQYLTQMLLAQSDAFAYPAPVIYTLQGFEQVQASVFQLTRGPGKWVVYLGCILLIIGVLAMLYVHERRLWVWLADDAARSLRLAVSYNRKTADSERATAQLQSALLARAQHAPEGGAT